MKQHFQVTQEYIDNGYLYHSDGYGKVPCAPRWLLAPSHKPCIIRADYAWHEIKVTDGEVGINGERYTISRGVQNMDYVF